MMVMDICFFIGIILSTRHHWEEAEEESHYFLSLMFNLWWVLSIKHVCSLPKQVQWNQSLSRSNRINLLSASTDGKILNWAMDGKGQLVLQDGFALVVQQMPRNVKLKASSLCNVIRCWNWVWRSPKAGRLLLPRLKFGNHRSRISSEFYLDNLAASFSVIPMETRLLVHNQMLADTCRLENHCITFLPRVLRSAFVDLH